MGGPPRGRGRGMPVPDLMFEAGLAGVMANDSAFARACLESSLVVDDGPGPGAAARRERRIPGPFIMLLHRWRHDRRIAPVRDPASLARMDEADRTAWEGFWSKVDERLAPPK